MWVLGESCLALVSGQSQSQWHGVIGVRCSQGDGRTCSLGSAGMLSCSAVVSHCVLARFTREPGLASSGLGTSVLMGSWAAHPGAERAMGGLQGTGSSAPEGTAAEGGGRPGELQVVQGKAKDSISVPLKSLDHLMAGSGEPLDGLS